MRINNSKVKGVVVSGYFVFVVISLTLLTVFNVFSEILINPVLIFIFTVFIYLAIFVLTFKATRYFEYDSDGLKVGLINKGLLSNKSLKSKEHTLEIDKEKLISYKFQNFIFYKRLVLHVLSRHGHKKKVVFNVTLVSGKKRKYIKQSLNKIVRINRKKADDDGRKQ